MSAHRPLARPDGRWMLRHARQMRRDPLTFLAVTAAELGDIVQFPVPGRPVFYVNEPVAVQRVLRDNHRAYGNRTVQYDTLRLVTGDGLLTADHEPWRDHRRIAQPAFQHGALEPLVAAVGAATDRVLDGWDRAPEGSLVDVQSAMSEITLDVVGQALLTTDLAQGDRDLAGAVLDALAEVLRRAQNPLAPALSVPTPSNLRLRRAVARVDAVAEALVAQRRRQPPQGDLLGLLLASGMSDQEVRDEVVTAVVAGHETVAAALTWAWHLLATHESVGDGLQAEVDQVLGVGPDRREVCWADLPRLGRTRHVLDETLRLYPPAWVVTRRALVEDELAGVRVPAGSLVIIGTHALHHRPDVWSDPDRFEPGRFERLTFAQRQAYLPFGSGPRLCIGRDFALVEATVVLARVSQRYALRAAGPSPRTEAGVTLRPRGGLRLALERRG